MAALDDVGDVEDATAAGISSLHLGVAAEDGQVVDAPGTVQLESAGYVPSSTATGDVAELLSKDAGDESLQRYKQQLLGAAAAGDLGDVSDPRRVIIEEFRVLFADPQTPDLVADLSTPEGLANLKKTGFRMKEGSEYKFRISFRVQHQIVTALTYKVSLTKMGFGESDEVVLGSYAPQTALHSFEYPRNAWEQAPKGMMYRGKATAKCKFIDGDKNVHVDFSYPVTITK